VCQCAVTFLRISANGFHHFVAVSISVVAASSLRCHCDRSKGDSDSEFIIECSYAVTRTRVKIYEILIYHRLVREKMRVSVRASVSCADYVLIKRTFIVEIQKIVRNSIRIFLIETEGRVH